MSKFLKVTVLDKGYCKIVMGQINVNTIICYGVYTRKRGRNVAGTEFFEYYSGKEYVGTSTVSKSYSTGRPGTSVPKKYKKRWEELREYVKSKLP